MLIHVVARALHECTIDALFLGLPGRKAARQRLLLPFSPTTRSTAYIPSVNAGARIATSPRASMTKEFPSNTSSS